MTRRTLLGFFGLAGLCGIFSKKESRRIRMESIPESDFPNASLHRWNSPHRFSIDANGVERKERIMAIDLDTGEAIIQTPHPVHGGPFADENDCLAKSRVWFPAPMTSRLEA